MYKDALTRVEAIEHQEIYTSAPALENKVLGCNSFPFDYRDQINSDLIREGTQLARQYGCGRICASMQHLCLRFLAMFWLVQEILYQN